MCGILGYIGKNDAKEILLTGLKRLEYRGYDSAGVALVNQSGVQVFKVEGKTQNLINTGFCNVDSTFGIGHTRWATKGRADVINAHPHQSSSGRFTLVHNGVIENEASLKKLYLPEYPFISDNDSEVVVALIELFAKECGKTHEAIQKLLTVLAGTYAICVIDAYEPDVVYAIRDKTSLLIGIGDGFCMTGSDMMSMSHCTNEFISLDNQEYAKITRNGVTFFTKQGQVVKKESFVMVLDESTFDKGDYDHYLLKEIDEQPVVIKDLITEYLATGFPVEANRALAILKNADKIYLVAGGTTMQTSYIGKQLIEKLADIPTEVLLAAELVGEVPLLAENPVFVFPSPTGESCDARDAIIKVQQLGYKAIAITNSIGSTVVRLADETLYLKAGTEVAVTSTKTYLAQLTLFLLIARELAEKVDFDVEKELLQVSAATESVLAEKAQFQRLAQEYLVGDYAIYLGRKQDQYTAAEGALKLQELAYIKADGLVAGELKYGKLALIEEMTPVIGIIADADTNLSMRSSLQIAQVRGAKALTIATACLSLAEDQIIIPDVHPLLTSFVTIIPTQLLAYYAGVARGIDVDEPRHLAKLY